MNIKQLVIGVCLCFVMFPVYGNSNFTDFGTGDPQLDELATGLEGERLLAAVTGRNDYVVLFFVKAQEYLKSNPDKKWVDLEKAFRSINAGLNLVAIPMDRAPEGICVDASFSGKNHVDEITHFIYLLNGDPAKTILVLNQIGVESYEQNLVNLENAGTLVVCNDSGEPVS